MNDEKKIGDNWKDSDGNEYVVTDIQNTVIISESVDLVDN